MDLYGWADTGEDLLFAQAASTSGQFAQRWQLRVRAQEAALKGVAKSKLRRLLAYNQTFDCVDIKVGDLVLFLKRLIRKVTRAGGARPLSWILMNLERR